MTPTPQIGSLVESPPVRRPLGEAIDPPAWFILKAPPLQERRTQAWLSAMGLPEVWMPTEQAFRNHPNRRASIVYERRIAPGYLFALFDRAPVWDVLFAWGRGRLVGVVGIDGVPREIREEEIAAMQLVPERLEELHRLRLEAEEQERLAQVLRSGDRARLDVGPAAGQVVDVRSIHQGIARFLLGGWESSAPVASLRRIG